MFEMVLEFQDSLQPLFWSAPPTACSLLPCHNFCTLLFSPLQRAPWYRGPHTNIVNVGHYLLEKKCLPNQTFAWNPLSEEDVLFWKFDPSCVLYGGVPQTPPGNLESWSPLCWKLVPKSIGLASHLQVHICLLRTAISILYETTCPLGLGRTTG